MVETKVRFWLGLGFGCFGLWLRRRLGLGFGLGLGLGLGFGLGLGPGGSKGSGGVSTGAERRAVPCERSADWAAGPSSSSVERRDSVEARDVDLVGERVRVLP